jgi:8-oxo-dGTP pyrophosphatase MutT (NUDIX family)
MSENRTYSAGGIVVGSDGRVLLVQEYDFYWGLPRGHIEAGESAVQTAKREIYEEAGISSLALVKELGAYERYRFDEHGNENRSELKHITFFLFTTSQVNLQPHDENITAAEWTIPERVAGRFIYHKDIDFYNGCLDVVQKLAAKIKDS